MNNSVAFRRRLNHFQSTRSQQKVNRRKIAEYLTNFVGRYSFNIGLKVQSLQLEPILPNDSFEVVTSSKITISDKTDDSRLKKAIIALKSKDQSKLSNKKWELMHENMGLPESQSIYQLKKVKKRLNNFFPVIFSPENGNVYIEPKDKIFWRINSFFRKKSATVKVVDGANWIKYQLHNWILIC